MKPVRQPNLSIESHSEQLVLKGMTANDFPILPLSESLGFAEQNVNQAANLPDFITPVFVGIEHAEIWNKTQPKRRAIVIEKSQLRFAQSKFDPKKNHNLRTIIGDLGFHFEFQQSSFSSIIVNQDLAALIYRINLLEDDWLLNIRIFLGAHHPNEIGYLQALQDGLNTLSRCRRFHSATAPTYQRHGKPRSGIAILYNHRETPDSTDPFLGPLYEVGTVKPVVLPAIIDEAATLAFIQQMQDIAPEFVATINRRAFLGYADVFFIEEALRRLHIPVYGFFPDWFTQQSPIYTGGWSFLPYCESWPASDKRFFSAFREHTSLHLPENTKCYTYPFRYVAPNQKMLKPLNEHEMQNDVSIIHVTRPGAIQCNEVNELYEMISDLSCSDSGQAHFTLLYQLRKQLKQGELPLAKTQAMTALVNRIDFMFYSQTRIRNVLQTVKQLKDLRVAVYGGEWHYFLPPELCRGWLQKTEDIQKVHQTSTITIDFTQMFTSATPHFSVIECLCHGGLPLSQKAFYQSPNTNPAELLTFDYWNELPRLIRAFVQNFSSRNEAILHAQQTWLQDWKNKPSLSGAEIFSEQINKPLMPEPVMITSSENINATLLQASYGYLLALMGFLDAANTVWCDAIDAGLTHPLLIQRTIKTARELGRVSVVEKLSKMNPSS